MALRRWDFIGLGFVTVVAYAVTGPAFANDLFDAVRANDVTRVERLLQSGADPNRRSSYDGPLHVAARLGSPEMLLALIESGAGVELQGYAGMRPLHAAALADQEKAVAVLLDHGAKVDALDNVGRTPLMTFLSAEAGNSATLRMLLNAGANPNLEDGAGRLHALDYAALHGRADLAELLIAAGADVNARDSRYGQTALHYAIYYCRAAEHGKHEIVQFFIDQGADVNAKDLSGMTPLDFAKRYAPFNGLLHEILVRAGAR